MRNLQERFARACAEGILDSWFAGALIYLLYATEADERAEVIAKIANNLSEPATQIFDLQGGKIFEGSQRTFSNNLSRHRKDDITSFKLYNSLAHTGPNTFTRDNDHRIPEKGWLKPQLFDPLLYYLHGDGDEIFNEDRSLCQKYPAPIFDREAIGSILNHYDETTQASTATIRLFLDIANYARGKRRILSYTKRPEDLAYMAVEATRKSRKTFALFGEPITLTARAYAKPFGGRVGPDFEKLNYTGTDYRQPGHIIPKILTPSTLASTIQDQSPSDTPNFPKYPGDRLGLKSTKAFHWLADYTYRDSPSRERPQRQMANNCPRVSSILERMLYKKFDFLGLAGQDPSARNFFEQNYNDSLYQYQLPDESLRESIETPGDNENCKERDRRFFYFELYHITPNIFDIAYFSIEPAWHRTYDPSHPGPSSISLEHFGYRPRSGDGTPRILRNIDGGLIGKETEGEEPLVLIPTHRSVASGTFGRLLPNNRPSPFWIVKEAQRLLNAWTPSENRYGEFGELFQTCTLWGAKTPAAEITEEHELPNTPGNCYQGGRVGYSVKLVSPEYLKRELGNNKFPPDFQNL